MDGQSLFTSILHPFAYGFYHRNLKYERRKKKEMRKEIGALTLAVMNLPMVMRTTQESLKTVPQSYREGAFGL